jgi:hypothetical protein
MCFEAIGAGLRLNPFKRELNPADLIHVDKSPGGIFWNLMEVMPIKRLRYGCRPSRWDQIRE